MTNLSGAQARDAMRGQLEQAQAEIERLKAESEARLELIRRFTVSAEQAKGLAERLETAGQALYAMEEGHHYSQTVMDAWRAALGEGEK